MDKQKNDRSAWSIMQPVKAQIWFAILLSVVSCMCSIGLLLCLSFLIRDLFNNQLVNIWLYLLVIFTLAILAFFLRAQAFNQSHYASFRLENILREGLTQALARVPLGFISKLGSGAIAKILKDDVRNLHVFVADSTPLYARAYFLPVLTFVILLWIDWSMALITFAVLAIGMMILSFAMKDSTKLHQQYNLAREDISNKTIEFVQAMPIVRTFGGDSYSFQSYQTALEKFNDLIIQWYKRSGTAARLSLLILNPLPTLVALIWAGFYFYYHQKLSFAEWQAILLIGTGMAEALLPYMSLYHMNSKAKVSIDRIYQLQHAPSLVQPKQSILPTMYEIEFKDVYFKYADRDNWALQNINLKIPQNKFTAIVGVSGAGKSTLAKLIARFWDVDRGEISIGGVNVMDISHQDLMSQVSIVFQENFLFSGTIAENICLGMPQVTEQQMIVAAKTAQIHDFILSLEKGYQTDIGERGGSLSGGQIQRLTIARAILQDRPIILFDEATAYFDAENEVLLMQAISALIQNKTVLMIAHRLSTIVNADNILFFENGQLIEQGSHTELIDENGMYADLWRTFQTVQHWQIDHSKQVSIAQESTS